MSEYAGFIGGDCSTMDGGAGLLEGGGGTFNACIGGALNNGRNSSPGPQQRPLPHL